MMNGQRGLQSKDILKFISYTIFDKKNLFLFWPCRSKNEIISFLLIFPNGLKFAQTAYTVNRFFTFNFDHS
jgi:hypothetical protein